MTRLTADPASAALLGWSSGAATTLDRPWICTRAAWTCSSRITTTKWRSARPSTTRPCGVATLCTGVRGIEGGYGKGSRRVRVCEDCPGSRTKGPKPARVPDPDRSAQLLPRLRPSAHPRHENVQEPQELYDRARTSLAAAPRPVPALFLSHVRPVRAREQTLLERHPARLFRLFCLQHHYASNVDYNDDRMRDAAALDKRFAHFFTVAAEGRQRAAILDRGTRDDSDRDLHHA